MSYLVRPKSASVVFKDKITSINYNIDINSVIIKYRIKCIL